MKKEVKRRAIECAAAAVLYIVAIVGSSYAELEREMRLLIFPDWKAAGTYFHEQDEKIY